MKMKKNNSKNSAKKKKLYLNEFDIFKFLIENSSEKNRFLPIKKRLAKQMLCEAIFIIQGNL